MSSSTEENTDFDTERPAEQEILDSPAPSCVCMKNDRSMDRSEDFTEKDSSAGQSVQQGRSDSPDPSCVSMKSDQSMEHPPEFSAGHLLGEQSVQQGRSDSPDPSCVSMKSDQSMEHPPEFSEGHLLGEQRVKKETSQRTQPLNSIFKDIENEIITTVKNELMGFQKLLNADYPECIMGEVKEEEEEDEIAIRELALKITLSKLRKKKHTDLADLLQKQLLQHKFRSKMKEKFKTISEGISKAGNPTLLKKIYTELYITEGESGEVNNEHEVRQIEKASRKPATAEIPCNDIFKPLPGQDKPIRTVLTKGVAGIGKTVSVQKFILDWADGAANQDVHLIFPLPFCDLNLMKEKKASLLHFLQCFFPEAKDLRDTDYEKYKILFIFDGLDECRLPLDFHNNEILCNITESTSVDVLVTNLIKGNLLPSALIWITSRPAAANQIPPECVARVTEVRGFNDPQKEEYFRKRISDQNLAGRVIKHIKSSRSLYIMCHIPVFCWISATVLVRMLTETESGEIPKTLTQMYIRFLIIQINLRKAKYTQGNESDNEFVFKLGKLASQQLQKGNLIFYEEDMRECGIDVKDVSVYSGVCTQIFREEFGLEQRKVYSFVHLSIQEFIAALYVFLSLSNRDDTEHKQTTELSSLFNMETMSDLLRSAVDKALQSENGHLDLFLRFLLGLSLESNQTLLQGLLTQTGSSSQSKEETVKYIKEKIRENPSPEKSINLFHCLNELNDQSLVKEVQAYLNRGDSYCLSHVHLSPAQWSAVVFVLLTSEEKLDEFKLSKYTQSEECLLRLLPVVRVATKAVMIDCKLTENSCGALASVLNSKSSSLRELDLSYNKLQDSGVKLLSAELKHPNCKLEILRLEGCNVTQESCEALASVFRSTSSLRKLDLSNNDLQYLGVRLLSAGLESLHSKLETLRLCNCKLLEESCAPLASVLSSKSSSLRDLDLSKNNLQDSGVKRLSAGLQNPHCKLEILNLCECAFTEEGCKALASALRSNPSYLRELSLNFNKLGDAGAKHLSALLENPHCKLEKLELFKCSIAEEGCAALASSLKSNPSHLKELNLSMNKPGDSVKLFSLLHENPHYKLEKLENVFLSCYL